MWLKLKIMHLSFLDLKIVINGYCGNDGFIFAWDLGVIFLGIPNLVIGQFLKFFFLILVLKVSWKSVLVVSLYTYFWGFFN